MAAGSLAAHGFTYAFVGQHVEGAVAAREVAERSSGGFGGQSVMALGVVTALVVVAAISCIPLFRGRGSRGAPPWLFVTLPPLAFGAQELIERLMRAEAAPFRAAVEPRLLMGLLLQIPFGIVALLVARPLLRVVRRIARALGRLLPPAGGRRTAVHRRPATCELPRIPALALGYPQRGPPSAT